MVRSRCPPRINPNDMALSNVLAPGSAVTGRPPASVSMGCAMPSSGGRAGANQSIFGLEEDMHSFRDIVRDHGRNSNAEVHQHAGGKLLGSAAGNDGLSVHDHLTNWRRDSRPPAPAS